MLAQMTDFAVAWSALDEPTRNWLADHNGEVVPEAVAAALAAAGGSGWLQRDDPDGPVLADEVVDWIESVANGE